jgi:hypothetical protein
MDCCGAESQRDCKRELLKEWPCGTVPSRGYSRWQGPIVVTLLHWAKPNCGLVRA